MQALMMNTRGRQPHLLLRRLILQGAARRFEVGDVGILVLRHMRQIQPTGLQPRARRSSECATAA